jgi:DNA recombination protein RmuC
MTQILLVITLVILVVNTLLIFFKKPKFDMSSNFDKTVGRIDTILQDQFQRNRTETSNELKDNRQELSHTLNQNTSILKDSVSKNLKDIRQDTNNQLDRMRETVDEKLQKTINARLKESFGSVSKQLESVQQGLGEMKSLATDVGGLKKVLSNVKTRGGLGEMQLEMLLENILAPGQFSKNVITNPNTSKSVEFVVNLPGHDENRQHLMLPIDAKFPKDIYEELLSAYDSADMDRIKMARKELRKTIKSMAKDISTKYIFPPITTDFAYLFLPFEGLFAEVTRDVDLISELHNEFKITVTGPSTLGAILNGLQMGFRTLAIQKRTSEVWEILSGVKKEFSSFSDLMGKAQKNIQMGLGQLDDVMGVRTRAIQRNLRNVELSDTTTEKYLLEKLNKSDNNL